MPSGVMTMIVDPERRRAYKRQYYQAHKGLFAQARRDYWRRRKEREKPEEAAARKRRQADYMNEYNRRKRVEKDETRKEGSPEGK